MQPEIVRQSAEAFRNAFASLQELGEINTKAFTQLTDQQFTFAGSWFEATAKHSAWKPDTNTTRDLFAAPTSIAVQYNQLVADHFRKTTEIMTETKEALSGWLANQFETINGSGKNGTTTKPEVVNRKATKAG